MMLQVRKDADHTELYSRDLHSLESHALDLSKQQLTHAQRIGIRQAVRAAPDISQVPRPVTFIVTFLVTFS